ncbi:condensation domain-containing protein [uncultured Eubacterium sp.]|uniref:condensation domain-containing protein n=1 Tax=uncultured Eubacterium sp. TaxID=165185 RepID=UPI002627CBA6|nr:condensation domain-containing protein [uncultured Eubacterium sp.]
MKKLRVIVCGSTFGQYYIRALQTVPDEFEVVGLLANGSNRSKLCADFYHVPLYTQIEDIPEVDIACVVIRSRAVGGSGTDIAEYFLNKKVHVIQEQPIHPKDMEVCYRAAKKNHVLFQMGDLYPNLIEVKNFIKCARYLNKKENPLYLRASFSPQVSYPAIDIISRIVPSIHTWKIKSITKELGPFDILMGEIGKTPIFIEYHNQVDPRDPDNYMHLLHSFTLFYSTGKLVLEDTFGPVLWKPRMHDMLRTVVFEEGYQQVLKEVPELEIPYWDVSKGENICEYNDFRQQMGNHVYDTGKWPMFGIAIAKKAEESILHFSMDFLIADWTSIWMLLSEFEALYYLKKDSINVPQITFRDYLSAERKLKESERYVNDKRYWEKRIAYLPDAPELPTLSAEDVKKNFTRKLLCLDSERWNSFKDAAKKLGITPSTAILTAYSDVIAKWSCNKSFCINLTVLNRFPLHDDVTDIVGDFTTLNLLEINANDGNNFAERARKINERLFIDLDHRLFGGVEVIRELSKQRNKRVFMPIVYTSAIGLADQNRQITGKFDGGITQTPQVFIDCQAMDGDFGLQINWDVREGVFPDGMIDDMFDLFQQRIEELAKDETDWNKINGLFLPQWQADERNVANHTETDLPIHLLQSGFMEWAQKAPDRVAVTDGEKKLTYGELHQYALKIRQKIVNVGAKHQDCIAIAMNKSIYQVAASNIFFFLSNG